MAKKEFKKRYFLFGEMVCRGYNDYGIKEAKKLAKVEGFGLYVWDENSTPDDLLNQFEGWSAYAEITESHYKQLSNIN